MNTVETNLSKRVLEMEESATIKMAQMARDRKAKGFDVISLSLGEPDFDTPEHIKEFAIQALKDGYTKYTPVPGLVELREAICTKLKRDNDLDFSPAQVVVSNGAKQCINNLCMALLEPGDEAVILGPYWVSYKAIVELAGGTAVVLNAGISQDFKVTPQQLEDVINDKTKFVLFSSPCNPTGSVYTKEELTSLAAVISRHENVHIISDEIYEYINFTEAHFSIGSLPSVKDRTITVNGFAKGFAMTGWRLGYMAGPQNVMKACSKLQGQNTSGANAFGQKAAAQALLADMTPTYKMLEAFKRRRELVISLLEDIPGVNVNRPMGAFYIFPDVSSFYGRELDGFTINNSQDFCAYLLEKANVAVVPGVAFGDDNCFRLSYAAADDQLKEAIRRIKEALV